LIFFALPVNPLPGQERPGPSTLNFNPQILCQVKSNPAGLATIEGAQDIPMAVAAMEFASGQKDEALKSVKKVTDPRYRDLRYVTEPSTLHPKP
jgi:hypothetical protein